MHTFFEFARRSLAALLLASAMCLSFASVASAGSGPSGARGGGDEQSFCADLDYQVNFVCQKAGGSPGGCQSAGLAVAGACFLALGG